MQDIAVQFEKHCWIHSFSLFPPQVHVGRSPIRNSTIGIIGTGRIGYQAAKAWHGMGAKVLGYDIYESDQAKSILTYCDLKTLLK